MLAPGERGRGIFSSFRCLSLTGEDKETDKEEI
jgi:hypothetical protein